MKPGSGWDRLQRARSEILKVFGDLIRSITHEPNHPRITVLFHNGWILYIRYNDFAEYAYLLKFSPNPNDFIRFDTFDDKWDVPSKPHHYHLKGGKDVVESPMTRDPIHDIPLLKERIFQIF